MIVLKVLKYYVHTVFCHFGKITQIYYPHLKRFNNKMQIVIRKLLKRSIILFKCRVIVIASDENEVVFNLYKSSHGCR
jgi:hypothetical protein